jgi:hypothetical protein
MRVDGLGEGGVTEFSDVESDPLEGLMILLYSYSVIMLMRSE